MVEEKNEVDNLARANHNYEVCLLLQEHGSGKFNDWIMTTAYYSAMYYVYYQLFPDKYKIRGTEYPCECFSDYARFYNTKTESIDKHSLTVEVTIEYLPEIGMYMKSLKDLCFTARYGDYNIPNGKADIAIEGFTKIRNRCNVPRPEKKDSKEKGKPDPIFSTSPKPPS